MYKIIRKISILIFTSWFAICGIYIFPAKKAEAIPIAPVALLVGETLLAVESAQVAALLMRSGFRAATSTTVKKTSQAVASRLTTAQKAELATARQNAIASSVPGWLKMTVGASLALQVWDVADKVGDFIVGNNDIDRNVQPGTIESGEKLVGAGGFVAYLTTVSETADAYYGNPAIKVKNPNGTEAYAIKLGGPYSPGVTEVLDFRIETPIPKFDGSNNKYLSVWKSYINGGITYSNNSTLFVNQIPATLNYDYETLMGKIEGLTRPSGLPDVITTAPTGPIEILIPDDTTALTEDEKVTKIITEPEKVNPPATEPPPPTPEPTPTDKTINDLWKDETLNFEPLKVAGEIFTTRFPFSLPWDLMRSFQLFNDNSFNPVLNVNIPAGPILPNLDFNIDLSVWSSIVGYVKALELLIFDITLVLMTRKLLGGGV